MNTLTALQFSLDSCGRVLATAKTSEAKHPYYFSTDNLDIIVSGLKKRGVVVDKTYSVEDLRSSASVAKKAA